MGWDLMNRVFDSSLPPHLRLVALALASFGEADGTRIFPSKDTLAQMTGLTRRTIQSSLAQLRHLGLLLAVDGTRGGRGRATRYQMNLDVLREYRRDTPRKTPSASQETLSGNSTERMDFRGKGERESPSAPFDHGGQTRAVAGRRAEPPQREQPTSLFGRDEGSEAGQEREQPSTQKGEGIAQKGDVRISRSVRDPSEIQQNTEPPTRRAIHMEPSDGTESLSGLPEALRDSAGLSLDASRSVRFGPDRDHQDRGEPGPACLHDGERVEGDERGSERLRAESGVRPSTNGTNHNDAGSGQRRAGVEGFEGTESVGDRLIRELCEAGHPLGRKLLRQRELRRAIQANLNR